MIKCLICGKQNMLGKIFCTQCGNALSVGPPSDHKCPRCGSSMPLSKSFCTQCGADVSSSQPTPAHPSPGQPSVPSKTASSGLSAAKAFLGIICILGVAAAGGWWVFKRSGLFSKKPSGPYILASRLALSNGRTMTVRPVSQANPMGLRGVAGFGKPDAVPPVAGLFTTMAAQPDPLRITLDKDGDGQLDAPTPKSVAGDAANLLSCFSLLVAENFPAEGVRWENIIDRDLRGGLYATVNIPSADIFAGMPLITDDQLRAYTANSIIYEAPDYGISPSTVDNPKGGRVKVRAAPRPQPPTPNARDLIEAPEINYAIDVKVDIEVVSSCKYDEETIKLTLRANTAGFDPLADSRFRWAYDGYEAKFVKDVVADNQVTFFVPAKDKGRLISIWVAVSSLGIGVGNPNPFVQNPPEQVVGNMTFVTVGSAVSTMLPHTLTPKDSCDETTTPTPGPAQEVLCRCTGSITVDGVSAAMGLTFCAQGTLTLKNSQKVAALQLYGMVNSPNTNGKDWMVTARDFNGLGTYPIIPLGEIEQEIDLEKMPDSEVVGRTFFFKDATSGSMTITEWTEARAGGSFEFREEHDKQNPQNNHTVTGTFSCDRKGRPWFSSP